MIKEIRGGGKTNYLTGQQSTDGFVAGRMRAKV
jgi:hypothetical protein